MSSRTYTLKEIKDAINKHNTELNNDIKVSFTNDGLKFSSAKAEKEIFKANLKQPLANPVGQKRVSKPKNAIKGQSKMSSYIK